MEYDKTIPVRVPPETRQALDDEAKQLGVKLSWLVRDILTQHAQDPALTAYRNRFIRTPSNGKGDQIGKAEDNTLANHLMAEKS
jgi:hypothetical protein